MEAWIDGYLDHFREKVIGLSVYGYNNAWFGGHIRYDTADDTRTRDLRIFPQDVKIGFLFTEEGQEYLQEHGCFINQTKLRFISFDEDDEIIVLAGKADPDAPWAPAGAFLRRTPNGNILVIAYGPEQSNGHGMMAMEQIFEDLLQGGY